MNRLVLLLTLLLAACGSQPQGYVPPEQVWNGWHVRVETRPVTLRPGMNEFLVIVSDEKGMRPKIGMLVKIRTESSDWIQAIPDGGTGVYRRALPVREPKQAVLFVQLREEGGAGREGRLRFAFAPPA